MAWPTNLVAATPGDYYDVLPIDPTAQPITYVRVLGQTFQGVIGAKSRARIDLPYYDGQVTRDIIDASTTGRGAMSVMTGSGSPGSDISTPNGDVIFVGGPTALTPAPDQIATMQQQSDPFTHTPSHQIVKAYTEIRYFDGPFTGSVPNQVPSGNLIASYPINQWQGDGSTIPQQDGSPPPTFDPAENDMTNPSP